MMKNLTHSTYVGNILVNLSPRESLPTLRLSAINSITVALVLSCLAVPSVAGTESITQTKANLKQLEKKMSDLEQDLHVVHNRRDILNQQIALAEKEIGNTIHQLTVIQQNIRENQQQIQVLTQLNDTLNHQLSAQRELLKKHLRARYKIGEYQPMKWLLNQENPYTISRLLTYYQYIVKARQHTITQVTETQTRLNQNQEKLNQESQKQILLQNQVKQHQEQLIQNKRHHAALISSLDNDIQNKQQTLEEFHQNKNNLTNLIQSLAQQGLSARHYPLVQSRHHLPKPVYTAPENIKNLNQGVAFFAPEGTPVSAVYPGKVVFSDWLKGYGLLMIIDHGAGYMTLYAHNQALFKAKGAFVDKGEKIATVGHTGGLKKNGLYFEVRHSGKAIPPLEWLS